ncbi:MAG: ABC transporter ATP-binding protein [Dethiobacteria bacterium]|jgi:oligopeptide transport system ATP-binding protein
MPSPLLEVSNLQVSYHIRTKSVKALRGINFSLFENEILAFTGESGSGKTTAALACCGLLPANAHLKGSVRFKGVDLYSVSVKKLHQLRGKGIAFIFQDPQSALNPVLTAGKQVAEVLHRHRGLRGQILMQETRKLFRQVGLKHSHITSYPFALSGGECQRIMIAAACAGNPALLIADEPTSNLDLIVENEVLALLEKLQKGYRFSLLLISHDLRVIARLAQRVAIFNSGLIVEEGTVEQVFKSPRHPYAKRLLATVLHKGAGE